MFSRLSPMRCQSVKQVSSRMHGNANFALLQTVNGMCLDFIGRRDFQQSHQSADAVCPTLSSCAVIVCFFESIFPLVLLAKVLPLSVAAH